MGAEKTLADIRYQARGISPERQGWVEAVQQASGRLARNEEDGCEAACREIGRTVQRAAMLCARESVRRMSTDWGGGGGVIIFLSSRATVYGAPHEYVRYAVSPGPTDTGMLSA